MSLAELTNTLVDDELDVDSSIRSLDWSGKAPQASIPPSISISCQNTGPHSCETSISPSPCGNTYANLAMCVPCHA
jgi:hypothetical protein